MSHWSRRKFLKSSVAAVALGTAEAALAASQTPKGWLPRRVLGKTGAMVSVIGFGGGGRFCSVEEEGTAMALLERAWELGINYFDTAADYSGNGIDRLSEKRIGEFSERRRNRLFLATKALPRHRDGVLRSVEKSLACLRTDYLDLLQIHSLRDLNDVKRLGEPNGALVAARELKEKKIARFIGITGHNDGEAMAEALRRYEFDVVLMALNAAESANPVAARRMEPIPAFEHSALPEAVDKRMGIVAMKVMGTKRLVGTDPGQAAAADLLRFGLSLPVASVVIGVDQLRFLEENARAARAFTPMNEKEKHQLRQQLAPSRSAWQRFLHTHEDSTPA